MKKKIEVVIVRYGAAYFQILKLNFRVGDLQCGPKAVLKPSGIFSAATK